MGNPDGRTAAERARLFFEEHAEASARGAVTHLRMHYPAAPGAVPSSAEGSPRNTSSADIRSRSDPLLSVMNELDRN